MTDVAEVSDDVKAYLKKVVELRRSFQRYCEAQAEIDKVWDQIPEHTQHWLAHLGDTEYQDLQKTVEHE